MAPGAKPGKSIVLIATAVSVACLALLVLFGRPPAPAPTEPAAPPAAAAVEPSDPTAEPSGELSDVPQPRAPVQEAYPPPSPDEAASAEPEPDAEAAPAVPSGIGLFPPPGTDPIKVGIVVPDDYELPEGYLSHHQVMDDGRELPPILLFHPDFELLDETGHQIPLPLDHVVPPELAPPGMPVELLVVPSPLEE